MNNQPQEYYTPYQLKFPIEIEKIIETTDPVYTFCEVMNHIDLSKYLTTEDRRTGRPRYEEETLLKVILFAFMENGYESLRKIEKLCKTDIRFMWLLQDNPPPSHSTIGNFMNNVLNRKIDEIFADINSYIFTVENVDLNHVYIDGRRSTARGFNPKTNAPRAAARRCERNERDAGLFSPGGYPSARRCGRF